MDIKVGDIVIRVDAEEMAPLFKGHKFVVIKAPETNDNAEKEMQIIKVTSLKEIFENGNLVYKTNYQFNWYRYRLQKISTNKRKEIAWL